MKIGNRTLTTGSPIMVSLNVLCFPLNFITLYISWVIKHNFFNTTVAMAFVSLSLCSFALYVMVNIVKNTNDDIQLNSLD